MRDKAGNEDSRNVEFFVDTKKPKILKTEPIRDFASGIFYVKFQEENPTELILYYGSLNSGFNTKKIDIPSECSPDNRNNYECATSIDLTSYDGQKVDYYFSISDIKNQSESSKKIRLDVDTTLPKINSINYSLSLRVAEISVDIIEANFAEATYINQADLNPREKRLCSTLKNGICKGRVTLNYGNNLIEIHVIDKAGNAVGQNVETTL